MYLLTGTMILSSVVLWWAIALIVCQNPHPRWYGGDDMQAFIWTPLWTAGICLGLLFLRKSLPEFPPSSLEVGLSVATIVITTILYRLLKVGKRLAAYASAKAKGDVTQAGSFAQGAGPRPAQNNMYTPSLKKAA